MLLANAATPLDDNKPSTSRYQKESEKRFVQPLTPPWLWGPTSPAITAKLGACLRTIDMKSCSVVVHAASSEAFTIDELHTLDVYVLQYVCTVLAFKNGAATLMNDVSQSSSEVECWVTSGPNNSGRISSSSGQNSLMKLRIVPKSSAKIFGSTSPWLSSFDNSNA